MKHNKQNAIKFKYALDGIYNDINYSVKHATLYQTVPGAIFFSIGMFESDSDIYFLEKYKTITNPSKIANEIYQWTGEVVNPNVMRNAIRDKNQAAIFLTSQDDENIGLIVSCTRSEMQNLKSFIAQK